MKDESGPAFPHINLDVPMDRAVQPGMSLRDWFAGQALSQVADPHASHATQFERIAKECYEQADAMLKARAE